MYIVGSKELVAAQCKAGVIGAFPSLNARPEPELGAWLDYIEGEIAAWNAAAPPWPAAPYAANLIVHPSNPRLAHDLELICAHEAPIVITSLNAPGEAAEKIHRYGGVVFHDVSSMRHARKAIDAGVDGLILVCAGAGGHTGSINPLAFTAEVRRIFDGPIALAGCITHGSQLVAALAMGADYGYVGTRFIASNEANAAPAYKDMIVASSAADIVRSTAVTGLPANYLVKSFEALGIDAASLPERKTDSFSFGKRGDGTDAKAWRDVWSAGQGAGNIDAVLPAAQIIDQLAAEYHEALRLMKLRV